MMSKPPMIAAGARFSPVRSQSTIATRKIVRLNEVSVQNRSHGYTSTYSAATEDKTGDVSEMSTKKDPEKVALASTEIASIQAASPCGSPNLSMPSKCSIGNGIHSTNSVKHPIRLPKVIAKIMPRSGLVPSGGHASFLYSTS